MSFILCLMLLNSHLIQAFELNTSASNDIGLHQHRLVSDIIEEILKNYSVFVVVCGTIFNLINFTCFYRMKKRSSQNVYLSALSLAELFNIQINILVPLIRSTLSHNDDEEIDSFDWSWKKFLCILDGYLVESKHFSYICLK